MTVSGHLMAVDETELGLLVPPGTVPDPAPADPELAWIELPTIRDALQYFAARVRSDREGGGTNVILINALSSSARERTRIADELQTQRPGVELSWLVEGETGRAIVEAGPAHSHLAHAAAAATYLYTAAWDESEAILVTVNQSRMTAKVKYGMSDLLKVFGVALEPVERNRRNTTESQR